MSIRQFEGHLPKIGQRNYIDASAVVAGRVTLGDDVSIWPHVAARGDVNFIEIGDSANKKDN
jgi:carbonic anhydrase/acetyltransferase-like protein (isoleucine patch superfamily)